MLAAVHLASALLVGCADEGAALRAPGLSPLDAPSGGALDVVAGPTATSPLPEARSAHTAVLLPTGRVLVFGGRNVTITGIPPFDFWHTYWSLTSSVVYEPATGTWSPAAPAPTSAKPYTPPIVLQDGRVMLLVGSNVHLYDPTLDTWAPAAAMPTARYDYAAAKLPDGRVLVVGGKSTTAPFAPTSAAEIYDPATGTWVGTTPMTASGAGSTGAVSLLDGRVLVVGSFGHAELYDPASATWAQSLPRNHAGARAALLSGGKVLTVGQKGQSEIYDPATNAWTIVEGLDTSGEFSAEELTPLGDGRALLTGGYWVTSNFYIDEDGFPSCGGALDCIEIYGFTDAVWLFDPATQSWAAAPPMTAPRALHSATLLPDGAVLIAGGDVPESGITFLTTDAAEIYVTQGGGGAGGQGGGGAGGQGGGGAGGADGSNGTGGAGGLSGTGGAGGPDGGAGGPDGGAGGPDGGAGGLSGTGGAGGPDGGAGGPDGGAGGPDGGAGGSVSQGSSGDPGPGASGPGGSSGGLGCSAGEIGATSSAANGCSMGVAGEDRGMGLGALALLGALGLRRRPARGHDRARNR